MSLFLVRLLYALTKLLHGPSVVRSEIHSHTAKKLVDVFVGVTHGQEANDYLAEDIHLHE